MKTILFITGTRADFGKLKPLMQQVEKSEAFKCDIFITGMHTLRRYGYTADEITRSGFENTFIFLNQSHKETMDQVLANTIHGLSLYIYKNRPDLIIVHGDRVEALAGAIVGSLNNILVGHIEGGEVSGTIDESIRHAVTKLSHLHFVSNEKACQRLIQLGEKFENIYVIGSPNIDVMLSQTLPTIEQVKEKYEINFDTYHIAIFHSITTELDNIKNHIKSFVDALIDSNENYVIIYPNNDTGCSIILDEYKRLKKRTKFRLLPSMRFEYFITLLKYSISIIGNSSSGIIEAPVFGKPSINIGTRQNRRFFKESIKNISYSKEDILSAIKSLKNSTVAEHSIHFGQGNSAIKFMEIITNNLFWKTSKQKYFMELSLCDE